MKSAITILSFILFLIFSCKPEKSNIVTLNTTSKAKVVNTAANKEVTSSAVTNEAFNAYWYSGKAELSSYVLKQARYNEIRTGEVVLIFVTEPFSLSKQVKLDHAEQAGEDKVTVMKLNQIRKFNTGIYDYSIVTSTFTPIDFTNHPLTLKATTSIQEWCGHTFTQLNLDDNQYNFKQFSYFEADGDEERKLNAALLEEDLMTRIRIHSGQLPIGELQLIPSTIYSRFNYKKMQAHTAEISKTETETTFAYTINYLDIDRTLSIEVEKEFPYKILEWTEDAGDGFITTATLKSSLNEPYWNQKSVADEAKREALQLIK